ncbi:N-acetylmuramoyl-L-alanine amidase, partial [Bacillus cereus]|nr:N-acetylmuramoyl-L-alanine amidase [Bacillus cereus]
PSATFEGTKASLLKNSRTAKNRLLRSPEALQTNNIYGVTFKELIVPKGNDDIRPGYPMVPNYSTIHETANTAKGANA